jgi:hypothetical protein
MKTQTTTQKPNLVTAPPSSGAQHFSFKVAPKFSVDRTANKLRDVALLTAGLEAKGHGIYIDERTIETAAEVVALRNKRLKAAFRHPSLLDLLTSYGGDRMLEIPGFFSGVGLKGSGENAQLVASAFEFYDTFREANEPAVNTLFEMAEKTPELFGVSIEPWGYLVYVDTEDNEFSTAPEDRELKYNGLPALRVTDMPYAAFVDEPAANPGGVFATLAAKVPGLGSLFGGGARREQLTALGKLAEQFAKFCAGDATGLPAPASGDEHALEANDSEKAFMNILAQINAKFGADKDKLGRAFALLAGDQTLSIEKIETQLAATPATPPAPPAPKPLELSAVTAKFGADKARLAAAFAFLADNQAATLEQIEAHLAAQDQAEMKRLQDENAKLKADKAAADAKLTALQNSGHPAPLATGAASAGAPGEVRSELKGRNRVAAAFNAQLSAGAN